MSDTTPMICATSVMKPGRTRIGRIGGNLTLPRTVPVVNLVASGVGAFIGLVLAMAIGDGANAVALGLGLGGFAGWMAVTYSPLKNESLAKWLELQVKSQTRARYINGERVILAVGVGVVAGPSSGPVLLQRSAVRVPAGQYDDRGAPVSNARLVDHSHLTVAVDGQEAVASSLSPEASPTARRRDLRDTGPGQGSSRVATARQRRDAHSAAPDRTATARAAQELAGPPRRLTD